MPEIKVIEVIEPPVSVKLTNGVKGNQGKSIVSASFVGNDIVFVNDEDEEIVIEGGKTALIGSSAYQVWLETGNTGTVEDYLASLIGPQGNPGYTPVKGTDYFDGDDGLSAYQVWLAQGNVGSEAQFLARLKGNQWKGGYNPLTPYVVDDVVSYNGSSYICILASLGNLPSNTTYFSLFSQKGDNTTATNVTNTPSGNISSTTVQGAINELDTEKANITQEAWITPTLVNGASGTIQYRKTVFGRVEFKGTLIVSTLSPGNQFAMPVGYRPLSNIWLGKKNTSNQNGTMRQDAGGNFNVYDFGGTYIMNDFSYILEQ